MKSIQIAALTLGLAALAASAFGQDTGLTISGSVRPRTQLDLSDGTGQANLSAGPGGSSYLRFQERLSPWSVLVLKFSTPYLDDESGTDYTSTVAASNSFIAGVGIQEAYGATDILGELALNQIVGLKLQAGMFRLKAPVFSRGMNFGLGTGDEGSRSEVFTNYTFDYAGKSYESYKWSLELPVNALKDVFPLTVRVGSDLDLTGQDEQTGFTGYAEVSGRNLYLVDDLFVVDWALYYTLKGRDSAPAGTASVDGGQVFGGLVSTGFGFANGISIGLAGAADVAYYSYRSSWGQVTVQNYDEHRLNWQVGADVTVKEWAKVSGAVIHRTAFSVDSRDSLDDPVTPYDYYQNYLAFRLDGMVIKNLTPYFGGTYVLKTEAFLDPISFLPRGTVPSGDKLSWEAGLMWNLTPSFELDVGYTRGKNNALATFGAVINAIEQSQDGALFARAGWRF
jgi:hypothetical protein